MQLSDFFEYHFVGGVLDPTPKINYRALVRTFLQTTGPYNNVEEFIKALLAFARVPLDEQRIIKEIEEIVVEQQEKDE